LSVVTPLVYGKLRCTQRCTAKWKFVEQPDAISRSQLNIHFTTDINVMTVI